VRDGKAGADKRPRIYLSSFRLRCNILLQDYLAILRYCVGAGVKVHIGRSRLTRRTGCRDGNAGVLYRAIMWRELLSCSQSLMGVVGHAGFVDALKSHVAAG